MPPSETSQYRMFVEGIDDKHSIIHLLERHGFDWEDTQAVRPFVEEVGGLEKLLKVLPVALKGQYTRLGVVIDANSDLQRRWEQVRNCVEGVAVSLPDSPAAAGTIVQGRRADDRLGIWIMPDNVRGGALEDFILELVSSDGAWDYAEEAVQEARRRGARCRPVDHNKSRLHTWLAWQEEPGLPFGTAIRAGFIRHEGEIASRFLRWFNSLFGRPAQPLGAASGTAASSPTTSST